MADRNVTVTISARDNFSSVINKYQQAMGQAGRATTDMQQKSGGLRGAVDGLNSSFGTLFGAGVLGFGVARIAQLGGEMAALGGKVNSARSVFAQLTGGVGEAASTLQLLRESTHGTVADLDLMGSANALLLQGLAQTNEQAADLTGIAVTLGRAMGEDASGAVEKFSQLLRNQSIRLLDNFGLSSARVKDRMADLQSQFEGMSREQAFVQATIEESRLAIDRLGDSMVVTGSSTERLGTIIQNVWQQASSNVAAGVEGISYGIVTLIDIINEADRRGKELDQAEALRNRRRMESAGPAYSDISGRLNEAMPGIASALGLPESAAREQVNRYMHGLLSAFEGGSTFREIKEFLIQQYGDTDPIINALIDSLEELPDAMQDLSDASYKTFGEMGRHIRIVDRDTQNLIDSYREMYNESRRVQAAEESRARIVSSLASVRSTGLASLISSRREAAGVVRPGATYNTREQADTLNAMLADAESKLAAMENMDAIPADTVDRARELVDAVRTMADEANRGADAFERMSLSEAFGQTGGGLMGQVNQAVIDQMRAAGASDQQIAAFQRTSDLASGQETRGSLAFQEQIAPLIAQATQELGPQVGTALTDAVTRYLQETALNGGTATNAGMMGALTGAGLIVGGGNGQTINVRPGDTVSGLASQYGVSQEQIMAAAGITNPRMLQVGQIGMGAQLGFNTAGAAGMAGGYAAFSPDTYGGDRWMAGVTYDTTAARVNQRTASGGGGISAQDYEAIATSTGHISDDYEQIATDASTTAEYVQSAMTYAEQWREAQSVVSTEITQARTDLESLTGDVQQVTVAVEFTGDIETLKALMNGDLQASATVDVGGGGGSTAGAASAMRNATRDNYGSPPGVDPRVVGPRGL